MKTKKKKQESSTESSDGSDSSNDSSSSDDKKTSKKYVNETDVAKSKKSKKRKIKSSSSSSSSSSNSESSDDSDKKQKSKKSTKKSNDDDNSKERKTADVRLKASRHDLEASKWDSPSDKIMEGQKNRAGRSSDEPRRRSPDRPSHTREWDRGKPYDNRPRKYDDRRHDNSKPYDRNRHDFDRNRDNRNDRRYDDRDRRNDRRDFDNKNSDFRRDRKRDDDWNRNDRGRSGRSRSPERRGNFRNGRRNRSKSKEENYEWGKQGQSHNSDKKPPVDKEKPNFSLSGKLAEDMMTYRGVVIKYSEPPEARKPKRRWRLYPFKGEKAMQTLYIHRESAYLLGRERKVVDLPLDHPSCSKQHAALQYRLVPFEREDGSIGKRVRPYIIDLESANGTYVNNVKIEPKKYVELFEKDVLKFGYSTREYVLLHENSKDEGQDDDVQNDDEEVHDVKPKIKKERLEPMQPIIPQEAMIG